MTPIRSILISVIVVCVLFTSSTVLAQSQTTPFQIAAEFSALGMDRDDGHTGTPGVGLRAEFTLAPHVEIESRVTWFPSELVQEFQAQGGRTLQAAAGIRGKFWSSSHVSFYGLLLPGIIHVTNTVLSENGSDVVRGGATHFSLDTGLGVEWYAGERWTVRAEASGPLYGAPGGEIFRSPPGPEGQVATASVEARFVNPWQISAGLGYRFGSRQAAADVQTIAGRGEVGGDLAQTTALDATPLGATGFQHLVSPGVFASYRLAPAIYADGILRLSIQPIAIRTEFAGGHLFQALAGVKLGVRRNSYGIFGKVRGGVNSYSDALAELDTAARSIETRRSNVAALDVGGVVERYIGRKWLIRFDGSDVLSFYRSTTVTINGSAFQVQAPSPTDSIQLLVGVGWRF